MSKTTVVILCLLAAAWASHANAQGVWIGPGNLSATVDIYIANETDEPVVLKQSSARCLASAPESVTIPANSDGGKGSGTPTIEAVWTFHDDNDDCYLDHHNIAYTDVANDWNTFEIQQFLSHGGYACVDMHIFLLWTVPYAVCSSSTGSIIGAITNNDDNGTFCPPGVAFCPPTSSDVGPGGNYFSFGFVIRQAEPVVVAKTKLIADGNFDNPTTCLDVGSGTVLRNGEVSLEWQGDGNLVLYSANGRALWATGTNEKNAERLCFQGDGNLVIYDNVGAPLWASGTNPSGELLELTESCDLMIKGPTNRWQTNTSCF